MLELPQHSTMQFYFTLYTKRHSSKNNTQTNGIVDPEINPCHYSCQILDKGAQNIPWRKREPL
jgi:hypothetical protein